MRHLIGTSMLALTIMTTGGAVARAGTFSAWGHEFTTADAPPQPEATRSGPAAFNAMSGTHHRAHRRANAAAQEFEPR